MAKDDIASSSKLSDLNSLNSLTKSLTKSAEGFGKSITSAFAKGIVEGKRFEDVLRSVGKSMTESLLKSALKPVQAGLSSLMDEGVKGLTGLFSGEGAKGLASLFSGFASGGAAAAAIAPPVLPVSLTKLADGGIVSMPTYFPTGRGLGLMGEAGSEAIMPLSRGPDGKLGVRAGGEARRPLNVVVQVSTPDADSFRRSEAQVSAAIARAVARGSRAL